MFGAVDKFVKDCDTGSLRRLIACGEAEVSAELWSAILAEVHRRDVLAVAARRRVVAEPDQTIRVPRP